MNYVEINAIHLPINKTSKVLTEDGDIELFTPKEIGVINGNSFIKGLWEIGNKNGVFYIESPNKVKLIV